MTSAATESMNEPRPDIEAQEGPPFWRTYALAYALGAVFLALEILLLGTQSKYAFNEVYVAAISLPPVLTTIALLLMDRSGRARTLPLRMLVLFVVATITSVISTVFLTPLLILMFREGVGRSLSATGLLSAASLLVVVSPVVFELVVAARAQRWAHAVTMVAGLGVTAVAFSMALDPTGALASAMRLDQGELLMITSSWWLPVFALAAGFARRLGMA